MAIFLAAFALKQVAIDDRLAESLVQALSSVAGVVAHRNGSCAVAYVDLDLWPGRSAVKCHGDLTIVGGDPVLRDGPKSWSRQEGVKRLANEVLRAGGAVLKIAQGTFAGLSLAANGRRLTAFTDKLGVRPLYWAQTSTHVFVSSTFWALQGVPGLVHRPNWNAAAEFAAFGYPLGNRTLSDTVSVLGAGSLLSIDCHGAQEVNYWDWAAIRFNNMRGSQLLVNVERAFDAAVDSRLLGQKSVMAFLSGGMDSRLIVARLRARDVLVHSLNFAPTGSQDLEFGRLAAACMGTRHFEFGDGDQGFAERQAAAIKAWAQANPDMKDWPENPRLVWSGDGGSVSLGHVYLTSAAVAVSRTEGLEAAARELQRGNRNALSPRPFRVRWQHLAQRPLQEMLVDLQSRPGVEPGRNCHMFYMLNDQRRHLVQHFEDLHLRRVDLVLPFFDGAFLEAVLASPVDEFLEHKLYNSMMPRLPFGVGNVPWQAYPGHLPCPIPIDGGLRRQWEDGWFGKDAHRRRNRQLIKHRIKQLLNSGMASEVINRPLMLLLAALGFAGLDRYQYLIENCGPFLTAEQVSTE